MKKIFFILAILATTIVQSAYAQDKTAKSAEILTQYYAIKDALVAGNAELAGSRSADFIAAANSTDVKTLPEAERYALLKDATSISKTKDLKKQREYFLAFSDNMADLAKSTQLSTAPVYKAYCPMKKGTWLSSSSAIKNPYYGSSMLTCGKVEETL